MELMISTSASKHIDKFRAEKMFNLIRDVLGGSKIEIEGSAFVDCAKYVYRQQNKDLYFVLLGEDASPLTPSRCIVIDEQETIVFDPAVKSRTKKVKYLTEPVYYKADQDEKQLSKEIPFYIVARRQAGELIN